MIFKIEDILQLEQRYRTTFINSLAGFRQALLIGTKSSTGNSNLAIFNSLIHLGANPPLFGLISRPDNVQRDTLQNILDTKVYTLNYVDATYYKQAHQTSARYDKQVSEFEKTGFSETYDPTFYAPFVSEAVVKIALSLEQTIHITLNGTVLIIGRIMHVDIKDTMVAPDGFVDLSAAEVIVSQGLDAYFIAKALGRLPYPKP